jgi:hypothetical protein
MSGIQGAGHSAPRAPHLALDILHVAACMRAHALRLLLTLLLALPAPSLVAAPSAEAGAAAPPTRLRVNLSYEIPIALAGLLLWSGPLLIEMELPQGSGPLDRDDVSGLDQFVIDLHVPGARLASDVLAGVIPLAVGGAALLELQGDGTWRHVVEDALIVAEAMAVTGIVNQITRHAYLRPRPYMYQNDPDDERLHGHSEDWHSYFSGHTATAFAATTAFAMTQNIRRPGATANAWIWGVGMSACTTMGALRVLAGDHFVSDVVTGAAVGLGFGILIPWLHEVEDVAGATTSLVVTPGYAGLAGTF